MVGYLSVRKRLSVGLKVKRGIRNLGCGFRCRERSVTILEPTVICKSYSRFAGMCKLD